MIINGHDFTGEAWFVAGVLVGWQIGAYIMWRRLKMAIEAASAKPRRELDQ